MMRHVPTCLYIDTEFLKRQGLRFDTRVFNSFRETFARGGIRLLVPEIMERELLRHFHNDAQKAARAVSKAHRTYPVRNLPRLATLSLDDLESECFEEMRIQWSLFKEHCISESLKAPSNLEDVLDWYFETSPPFSETKPKEFPDALILSTLDQYHKRHFANIAVVSHDGDFAKACATRRYIQYFENLEDYIEEFKPELLGESLSREEIDLTKPITTEDLGELKAVLARGDDVTSIEIERVLQLIDKRGSNYDYFFNNAESSIWLQPLVDRGYFRQSTSEVVTPDGRKISPVWPQIDYLVRLSKLEPEMALNVVSKLPDTHNVHILEGIIRVVLNASSSGAVLKFSNFIFSFIETSNWRHDLILELLDKEYLFDSQLSDITPAILLKLMEFKPDPLEQEKRSRRREDAGTFLTPLEPKPHFDPWEYEQILEKGVCPLAVREPYQVSRVLLDATASLIRMRSYSGEQDSQLGEDYSEIWCRRLEKIEGGHHDTKQTLAQTLTFACEQVFANAPESVAALDQALRNQKWKIFKRLRQHLYALYPNIQTLDWIRELMLAHEDYGQWDHHYEFQRMIRVACEHFGPSLLSNEELTEIIDAILSGPSKDNFKSWMGEAYSEESFAKRQRYFHFKQLRPFAPILSGNTRSYYEELEVEFQDEPITDESYSPLGETGSGWVSHQSPKSLEDLVTLEDQEILDYLNTWDEQHRDERNWLIEIDMSALADEFQRLFKDHISESPTRLDYWLSHRGAITRPIYVSAMVKAMQDRVKDKSFDNLDRWIGFCEWVLSHPDTERVANNPQPSDESTKNPDWHSSRRAVVDFVESCLKKEVDAPITARDGLGNLLRLACTQFDWRLDCDHPVLLNRDDPITEAINNTRSRAIESLINYGFWVRRHVPEVNLPEVTEVLTSRLADDAELPLTRPEIALLGMNFGNLLILNQAWATEQKSALFPQTNESLWCDAFSSFIKFNRPAKPTFEILREDFVFGLQNLKLLSTGDDSRETIVDRLGQHLFTYYLWQVYPLQGETSLLEQFYAATDGDRKRWANLFNHVGYSLNNSSKNLEGDLVSRAIDYFDWRLAAAEPLELQQFTFWLSAECLDPDWRLESYSKVLDLRQTKDMGISIEVKTLNRMLGEHLPMVVKCFRKITDSLTQGSPFYVSAEEIKPILIAGLKSENLEVRNDAETARENLLRIGRFDLLDIESAQ